MVAYYNLFELGYQISLFPIHSVEALVGGIEAFKPRYEKVRELLWQPRLWNAYKPFENVIRFQKDTTWLTENYEYLKSAHEDLQKAIYTSLRKKNDRAIFELGNTSNRTTLSSLIGKLIEENIIPKSVAEYPVPTDENELSTFKEDLLNCFKNP